MIEWWTEANTGMIGGIGGAAAGVIGGGFGSLVGVCAPRGKLKTLIIGTHVLLVGASVLLLGAGICANSSGQPYHVFYPLMLAGSIGVGILGGLLPVTLFAYRAAEARVSVQNDATRDPNLAAPNAALVRAIVESWGLGGSLRQLSLRLAWVMIALTLFAGFNAAWLLANGGAFRAWFPWAMVALGPGVAAIVCWSMPRGLLATANNARAMLDQQRLAAEELRRG